MKRMFIKIFVFCYVGEGFIVFSSCEAGGGS